MTALFLMALGCAAAPPKVERIVAVGDLHGDLGQALTVLHLAGVTDRQGHWTGGATTLVQTGDVTDRGPDSKALIDLFRTLQTEARAAGGTVIPLLGNHEVMNLQGDWRYVTAGDVAQYGGADARRNALSPSGAQGAWLATLDVVARVGDTVFCHGGVHPELAKAGIAAINTQARDHLFTPGTSPVHGEAGPTWYRGFVQEPEAVACPRLTEALTALGAKRMVVGHTTRRDGRIAPRCDGALLVIDIGIAAHYGGNLGAIEIVNGDARALYPKGPVDLPDPE